MDNTKEFSSFEWDIVVLTASYFNSTSGTAVQFSLRFKKWSVGKDVSIMSSRLCDCASCVFKKHWNP